VDLFVLAQPPGAAVGTEDASSAGLGIDHPDQRHADGEIFADLDIDLVVKVVGGDNLDGEVRWNQDVPLGEALIRQAARADEGDVRLADESGMSREAAV